jgi:hypothetical protein
VIPGAVTQFKKAAVNAVRGMEKHHTMAFAAALSFRFTFPTTSMRGCHLYAAASDLGSTRPESLWLLRVLAVSDRSSRIA